MTLKKNFKKTNIGLGRRKKAVARVFLIPGQGKIIINNKNSERTYLKSNQTYLNYITAPLKILKLENQFDIIAIVSGGGIQGQIESIRLGIARLLCKKNLNYRSILKINKYLTRDARIKERKKYGLKKARKAPQYSKR